MHCPGCGFDNPEGMKFCGQCATPLKNLCPKCGFDNPPSFKFCGECASPLTSHSPAPQTSNSELLTLNASPVSYTPTHLAVRIRAEQTALEARAVPNGERKTITALFADIKGSMDLIEDLDPEEARRIVDPALQLMMDAVHRYEGYVVQSTGDGIFAFFGAPIAHEDHPHRALYAGLRMQEESKRYAARLREENGINLQIRVGVNTGEVVLRSVHKDDLRADYTPIGHSTSLAARMESLATPGSVLASENTYKLAEGYFEFKPLGAAKVKGVTEPVRIYEVLGIGPLRTRLQVAARRGLARFVGRQSELEQIRKNWELTKTGRGQIVGAVGEPGVGKSRLFHEFKLVAQKDCLILETFSVSHGKAYAYLPLIDLLHNYFQITPQDDERKRREKIAGKVLMLDRTLEDTLPYLFMLLGIAEANSPLQQMDPPLRKRRTLEAIKRLLARESLNQPLTLIFEDLHWLDSETQAFLTLLSESIATARILLLVNYRPEYRHDWGNKTFYTQLRLDPLGRAEAEEMLTALLGEKEGTMPALLLHRFKQLILEKTEGNPFFMEEIVRELVEQGVLARATSVGAAPRGRPPEGTHTGVPLLTELHLPTTVQAVLASRIDRLPTEEKELLQTLSVIGKEFSFGLLTQVVNKREGELQEVLSHLQEAEFIYEQPAFPEVEYIFKHALTQEVAYNSVLIERRKTLHEQTGRAIEGLFQARLEDHYDELAYHYSRSSNVEKAIEYLQRAGQQAVRQSAYVEAINHLTTALGLLQTLPDSLERAQQELTLQIALGAPLQAAKGPAAPETERAYTRAQDLCRQVGETPQLFPALRGLWQVYTAQGKVRTGHELCEQLFSFAQRIQDPALLLEAHYALGVALHFLGEFVPAREHLEQSIALYDPRQYHSLASLYGQDPGVLGLSHVSRALWSLGYPGHALKRSHEALALARQLSHPQSLALALFAAGLLRYFRGEGQAAQEQAEALIALSSEQGFPFQLAAGTMVRGWALAEQGRGEEGIAQMSQGLSALQTIGAVLPRVVWSGPLAESHGEIGRPEEGLTLLTEALALVDETGARFHEAEGYRIKGELLLQSRQVKTSQDKSAVINPQSPTSNPQTEAEACFLKAIEIARRQQAKSWELRSVISLARLWQQQGKKEEAQQTLAEIYNWFTEGFDTKDLQEAKALLEELQR